MEKEKIPCSVQVLTLNSGKTLERCLESVQDFAEIIILDGNSTDNTLDIARRYTDKIYPQSDSHEQNVRITDFAAARNRGLKLVSYDWFLFIDSDEYLSQEGAQEIHNIVARGKDNEYFVYNLPRKPVINGKPLDQLHTSHQIRFFYLGVVEGFTKRVHERIVIKDGYAIGALAHPEYVPIEDIGVLKEKWSGYINMQLQGITVTPKILFLKTRANFKKFLAYWAKYVITLVRNPGSRLPFWYEYHNAAYHLKIIWRLWKLYLTQKT